MSATLEGYVPVCAAEPARWTTTCPDPEAVALCVVCPLRGRCARQAYQALGAEGLWAGVVIPESGRARDFALNRLRGVAERDGYPVRMRSRGRPRGSRN
ncbi:hypothetical protein [Mycobacterium gordonae]|jgi:WhiB family redox-sensing transcriptional regulator|uniref:hypothetical protein n=1 Tax=Mycobacterium gordonae TaxID=1778 RepID=UPI0009E8868F|nr:hypothetical protein [Mycobacterium gordonae]